MGYEANSRVTILSAVATFAVGNGSWGKFSSDNPFRSCYIYCQFLHSRFNTARNWNLALTVTIWVQLVCSGFSNPFLTDGLTFSSFAQFPQFSIMIPHDFKFHLHMSLKPRGGRSTILELSTNSPYSRSFGMRPGSTSHFLSLCPLIRTHLTLHYSH